MSKTETLLIGKLAHQEGLITKEQLYDCLVAQERSSTKTLGSIMVQRGYLTEQDLERLLELQKKAFVDMTSSDRVNKGSLIFGSLLIDKGLATEYQVNEALRLQARFQEMGMKPIPPLGEILVHRGYVTQDAVEQALQLQNLFPYPCPSCGTPIEIEHFVAGSDEYLCQKCNQKIPFLFAKMAMEVQQSLKKAATRLEEDLPAEVRAAALDEKNNFGEYIFVREIGRGGAGIVYKAWQKERNKYVALKILTHHSATGAGIETPFGDAEDLKRFYSETTAAAHLSHPNIVPIYDIGIADQHFFFTMQFIEGAPLDTIIHQGASDRSFRTTEIIPEGRESQPNLPFPAPRPSTHLSVEFALKLILEITEALSYAHSKGVIHRDIKPQNILIDNAGRPWIMDFGLARVATIKDATASGHVVIGTPCYMSPEQASGDMEHVDQLSDIYSLGAVLYEMVTGAPPFTGSSNHEILQKVVDHKWTDPLTFNPNLPREVVKIIRRAMHRKRHKRYSSTEAMAADLRRYLQYGRLAPTTTIRMHRSWFQRLIDWFR